MSIDVLLDSQDDNNSCYCKIYGTNDDNADDTDPAFPILTGLGTDYGYQSASEKGIRMFENSRDFQK